MRPNPKPEIAIRDGDSQSAMAFAETGAPKTYALLKL
jgi:hypothetical protein